MRRLRTGLLAVALFVSLLAPFAAYGNGYAAGAAYDPLQVACDEAKKGGAQSANCPTQPTQNPLTGKDGVLMRIARIIAIIAGVAAIIVIIVSGFSYMTAAGDAQKAKKARDALVGALVGLFIIALASVIITFVVNNSGVQ